jgi:hypothetical protein
MPGPMYLLDSVDITLSGSTTSTTTLSARALGGHNAASYIVDVTGNTNNWDVNVQTRLESSAALSIAKTAASISGTGSTLMTLQGSFSATKYAIPLPTHIVYTGGTDGDAIVANVYAVYGD